MIQIARWDTTQHVPLFGHIAVPPSRPRTHRARQSGRVKARPTADPKGLAFTRTSWGPSMKRQGTIGSHSDWLRMSLEPSSPAAVAEGCTCPPLLNRHGRGTPHGAPLFYIHKTCPLHVQKPDRGKTVDQSPFRARVLR